MHDADSEPSSSGPAFALPLFAPSASLGDEGPTVWGEGDALTYVLSASGLGHWRLSLDTGRIWVSEGCQVSLGLDVDDELESLTKARLGAGISVDRRHVGLESIFRPLVDEIRARHPDRTRTLAFGAHRDCSGYFDADRLLQVLTNLVENARSPVPVTLRGEATDVVLSVQNYGPPIPEELLGRIFEPLQRGDGFDPAGRSVGLGLYIVKSLVDAHDGTIEVRSSESDGTQFRVRLPRSVAGSRASVIVPERGAPSSRTRSAPPASTGWVCPSGVLGCRDRPSTGLAPGSRRGHGGRVDASDAANWLRSARRPVVMRRRPLFVRDGRVGIGQTFCVGGEHEALLATPHYWFASVVDVRAGTLGFRNGHGLRPMTGGRFLLYLPAGSLVRMVLSAAQVETVGITSRVDRVAWPKLPLAIPTELQLEDAKCEEKLFEALRCSTVDPDRIDADFGLPLSTQRLRQRLLERALGPTPVTRVAHESRLSLPLLSRTFSAAFGVSPRSYCQRLRVYAAAVSLFDGVEIADAALRSGWQDLSRFYRQFRAATGETPGRYRTAGGQRFVK